MKPLRGSSNSFQLPVQVLLEIFERAEAHAGVVGRLKVPRVKAPV